MNPQFPLYIVSKGRHETRHTSRAFEKTGVPYFIIVEKQERHLYESVIDPAKILTLDPQFQEDYDPFWKLEPGQSKGSGPARNFAWEHSIRAGFAWHWVMDDNIAGFFRLNNNLKDRVGGGTIFRCMEDFCLRYMNIAMAGPQYFMFAPRRVKLYPFIHNTRIYSCNLIRNDVPFRWRGRYNEDTDLSLRMLKAGWCTVLFNAFLQQKLMTMSVKGGNTDSIYVGGTEAKSKMIAAMHPDVARVVFRFKRIHHHVDYSGFKTPLVLKPGTKVKKGKNEYGMKRYPRES